MYDIIFYIVYYNVLYILGLQPGQSYTVSVRPKHSTLPAMKNNELTVKTRFTTLYAGKENGYKKYNPANPECYMVNGKITFISIDLYENRCVIP